MIANRYGEKNTIQGFVSKMDYQCSTLMFLNLNIKWLKLQLKQLIPKESRVSGEELNFFFGSFAVYQQFMSKCL